MKKWLIRTVIALYAFVVVSCTSLNGYERRYSLGYEDDQGHRVDASVTLVPVKPVNHISSK